MKITRRQLKQIIKEELAQVLQEFDPQLGREALMDEPPQEYTAEQSPLAGKTWSPTRGWTFSPSAKDIQAEEELQGLHGPAAQERQRRSASEAAGVEYDPDNPYIG